MYDILFINCFDEQNMINKQQAEVTSFSGYQAIQSILIYKHSQGLRLNYDYRRFSQFIEPLQSYQRPLQSQVQCREFLYEYPHKSYTAQYYDLGGVRERIKETILNRVNNDDLFPLHFQNETFYHTLVAFKQKRIIKMTDQQRNPQLIVNSHHQQNLKLNSHNTPSLSPPKFSKSNPEKHHLLPLENNSQQASDNSVAVLEKITKDLSILLRKLSEDQLQVSLNEYLAQLQSSLKVRDHSDIFLRKEKEKSISTIYRDKRQKNWDESILKSCKLLNKKEQEKETYGLNGVRKKNPCFQTKKHNLLNSKTETVRKKVKDNQSIPKVSPETPKACYRQKCLNVREFSPTIGESQVKKKYTKGRLKSKGKDSVQKYGLCSPKSRVKQKLKKGKGKKAKSKSGLKTID